MKGELEGLAESAYITKLVTCSGSTASIGVAIHSGLDPTSEASPLRLGQAVLVQAYDEH